MFQLENGRLTFTHEDASSVREAYDGGENMEVYDALLRQNKGDPIATNAILQGPSSDQLDKLKENPENPEFLGAFDRVYGTGSAEFYMNEKGTLEVIGEHAVEVPGAVVRGVAGAVAETSEFVYNAGVMTPEELAAKRESIREDRNSERDYLLTDRMSDGSLRNGAPVSQPELIAWEKETDRLVAEYDEGVGHTEEKIDLDADSILRGTIDKPETLTGNLVEGVSQFVTGFVGPAGALGKLKVVAENGIKAKAGAAMVAGMITDFTAFDPDDPQFIDFLSQMGVETPEVIAQYIRKEEDDPELEKRAKAALEGAGLGLGLELVFAGIRGARKLYKGDVTAEVAQKELSDFVEAAEVRSLTPQELRGAAEGVDALQVPKAADEAPIAPTIDTAEAPRQMKPEELSAAAEGIEDFVPKRAPIEAAETLVTGQPARPVPIRQQQATAAEARRVALEVDKSMGDAFTEAAEAVIKADGNIMDDLGVRTHEELAQAASVPMRVISDFLGQGKLKELYAYAQDFAGAADLRIKQAAFQAASRVAKVRLDKTVALVQSYGDRAGPRLQAELNYLVDTRIREWLHLQSIDQDFGSMAGRMLEQRKTTTAVLRASSDEVATAVADASPKAPKAPPAKTPFKPNYLMKEYRRLRKLGVEPTEALDWIQTRMAEADRNHVSLKPGKAAKEVADPRNVIQRLMAGLEQWRYNSMLSGTRTHETNFLSGVNNMTTRLAYEGFYGAITGDKAMVLATGRKVSGMVMGSREALSNAFKAYRELKPILTDLASYEHVSPVYKNQILTYATRLMLGTDEMLKQLWYRGEVTSRALAEADMAKITDPVARKALLDERLKAAFDPESGAGIDMVAVSHAEEITFQKQFNNSSPYRGERIMAKATDLLTHTWVGRQMFPFTRIMFRLMDEGIRLTPLVRDGVGLVHTLTGGKSKFFDDLMGRNGKLSQARATGEYALGYASAGFAMSMAVSGQMTGGEPLDYVDAATQRGAVVPPYHIMIDGKWYDYGRFEPFAMPLKMVANYVQLARKHEGAKSRHEYESEIEENTKFIGSLSYIFAEAFTNNSFVEGFEKLVDVAAGVGAGDAGDATGRLVKSYVESYVPNILKKLNQSFEETETKFHANDLGQAITRHFTWMNEDNFNLDKSRDPVMGEPFKIVDPAGGWTSFAGKDAPNDPVKEMIIEANEATGGQFTLKRSTGFGVDADLRDHRTQDGKSSLYDRYLENVSTLELNGLTYREALAELASNQTYRSTPWGNSRVNNNDKVKMLRSIKSEYETAAEELLAAEEPGYQALKNKQTAWELSPALNP